VIPALILAGGLVVFEPAQHRGRDFIGELDSLLRRGGYRRVLVLADRWLATLLPGWLLSGWMLELPA
jgi:hypothetical protein